MFFDHRVRRPEQRTDLTIHETVTLLHPPPPLVGVSIVIKRAEGGGAGGGGHQNDSLVNGYPDQRQDGRVGAGPIECGGGQQHLAGLAVVSLERLIGAAQRLACIRSWWCAGSIQAWADASGNGTAAQRSHVAWLLGRWRRPSL